MKVFVNVTTLTALIITITTKLGASELLDYRLLVEQDEISTFENRSCSQIGIMCKNCKELVSCTPDGEGGWTENLVAECPDGTYCDGITCVKAEAKPECSPLGSLSFPCLRVGVFPDPANCKKYHICYPDEASSTIKNVDVYCENSDVYYYNPKTYFCDKKLPCNGYPIPLCKKVGDTAPIPQNPTLYYICLPHAGDSNTTYPFQTACENGKIYNSAAKSCR